MKLSHKYFKVALSLVLSIAFAGMFASCDDQPDEYEPTKGNPTIKYVRSTLPQASDSLLTSAYMESVVCIVGDNLRSIHEIWFNDQKAALNTSYMTDHTVIVAIPGVIPQEVTNKIYFHTTSGNVVDFDFNVLVPQPVISSMSNEWAKAGDEASLIGNYFIDDPNVPLEIILPGNVKVEEITSISKNQVSFIIPEGADTEGPITVKSIYGSGRSSLYFHDTRGMLFDWDGSHGGLTEGWGWRSGAALISNSREDVPELDGNYLCFDGTVVGSDSSWPDEDTLSFNYWPQPSSGHPELSTLFDATNWDKMQLKFEVFIPESVAWNTNSLNMIFTSNDQVTYDTASNAYIGDDAANRGLWTPWRNSDSGSYNTAGKWATVSFPLSSFNLTRYGASCDTTITPDSFTGLTFIMYPSYVVEDTEIHMIMAIDNIRVVPN